MRIRRADERRAEHADVSEHDDSRGARDVGSAVARRFRRGDVAVIVGQASARRISVE